MQDKLEDSPFDFGKECDPEYVLHWVDENALVVDKEWTPLCHKTNLLESLNEGGLLWEAHCSDCPLVDSCKPRTDGKKQRE